jgi:hypothetical protein
MIGHDSLLVTFVKLVDRLPMPVQPSKRKRGHPTLYSDRVFLKALVMMIVRHLHKVNERLRVLAQPTADMAILPRLLSEQDRFPSRRTWERQMSTLPETRPSQIGCLGRYLIELIQPWATCGRAVAIDCTVLRAQGGVWHQKHREKGERPHTSIDPEAHWTHIRVAWLGVWLETAYRLGRNFCVVPHRCSADPRQYHRWRACTRLVG